MRRKLNLFINIFIIINTLIISIYGFKYGASNGQVGLNIIGKNYFIPFTIDSNIFLAFSSLIYLIFKNGKSTKIFKLMGTTATSITFLTVITFLSIVFYISDKSVLALYSNDMFFFHVLNPILGVIDYIFLCDFDNYKKDYLFGLIPVVIYSIIYFINVIVLKSWDDFYGFTFNSRYYLIPLVIAIMYSLTYGVSYYIEKGRVKYKKRNKIYE